MQRSGVRVRGLGFDALSVARICRVLPTRRPDLANLRFTGCDGLPEGGQRLVKEGQLAATVIVQSNAGAAVSLVAAHMRTGAQPAARVVLPPRAFPPSR